MNHYTVKQFAVFRLIFGLYLTVHFAQLLPYATELFSRNGMIHDVKQLPTYIFGYSPIFYLDSPVQINIFLVSLILASFCFLQNYKRSFCSGYLFVGWVLLLNRNPFISNPSFGYVGWLLLACVLVPDEATPNWVMSDELYYGSWLVMAVSYTASGIDKLNNSPSWLNGTALCHVLDGPLARFNILHCPEELKSMRTFDYNVFFNSIHAAVFMLATWGSLFGDITFLFLGTFLHLRKWYTLFFVSMHVSILLLINFADLTIGMLMIHLFTSDLSWVRFNVKHTTKTFLHEIPTRGYSKSKIAKNEEPTIHKMYQMTAISAGLVVLTAYICYPNLPDAMSISIIIAMMLFFMWIERIFPDQKLPHVPNWWPWVLAINIFQAIEVILAFYTWEKWLQQTDYYKSSCFHLRDIVSPFTGGFIAYVCNTWLFYWWHYARHKVYCLWVVFHQFHHSAVRIESITSFYKHPLEILVDSQIMAVLLYSVLGLSSASSIWLAFFSCFGECFYHMNVKMPKFVGYFIQRRESHMLHHARNKREFCSNYADLPIFDMLNGTFVNPESGTDIPVGFTHHEERMSMLCCNDAIDKKRGKNKKSMICGKLGLTYVLIIWGALNSVLFLTHTDVFRPIGFSSVSSPLPIVFTAYKNVETFATKFDITVRTSTEETTIAMNHEQFAKINGPYNRRNVYGAMFAFGFLFEHEKLIHVRDQILHYGLCSGVLLRDFGLDGEPKSMVLHMYYWEKMWEHEVHCVV